MFSSMHEISHDQRGRRMGNRMGRVKCNKDSRLFSEMYTYKLSRLRRDSHACESKTLISRQITPAD